MSPVQIDVVVQSMFVISFISPCVFSILFSLINTIIKYNSLSIQQWPFHIWKAKKKIEVVRKAPLDYYNVPWENLRFLQTMSLNGNSLRILNRKMCRSLDIFYKKNLSTNNRELGLLSRLVYLRSKHSLRKRHDKHINLNESQLILRIPILDKRIYNSDGVTLIFFS